MKWISLLLAFMFVGCIGASPEPEDPYHGLEWTGANPAPLFMLESSDGELWSLEEQRNKTVVLAFTYTRCYATCPVTSASLAAIYESLSDEEKDQIEFVSVTIDPWHDSPSVLTNWTEERGYTWSHLTGTPEAVIPVLNEYGVAPVDFEDDSEEGYGFTHTQPTFIIDQNGDALVLWTEPDIPLDLFLEDLRLIVG
jgi:protein SCO1/2